MHWAWNGGNREANMIDEVEEYLRQRRSMVLATQLEGEVRASTTCFALGEHMHIYFFVFRDSIKHRGIVERPQVSLVIDDGFMVPMRGVEILGSAKVVSGPEQHRGQALLTKSFPELESVWDDPRILIVRVTPDRVRYTDWSHGVGHSREAHITGGAGS
jgi:general stress protein 26